MGPTRAIIHTNLGLAHQVAWAECLAAGFARHGVDAEITASRTQEGDIHVLMGPWYALSEWRGQPNVLYLDRAFWGDPTHCSLAWLDDRGEKVFRWGRDAPRNHPELQPWRQGRRAVVLCDYDMDGEAEAALARPLFDRVEIRGHPANVAPQESLDDCLARHDIALGNRTTALVDALIAGLPVICRDPHSPVWPVAGRSVRDVVHGDREGWITDLAWHNWSAKDIRSGEAWACFSGS